MKPIHNRVRKLARLTLRQRGKCGCNCGQYLRYPIDLHHRLHDTIGNRKSYPLLIDSVLNLSAVRHSCHMSKAMPEMSYIEADKYERFLIRHPMFAKIVNAIY